MELLHEKRDKMSYLKGMIRVSKANGVVEVEERAYIEAAAAGLGLDGDELCALSAAWDEDSDTEISFSNMHNAVFFIQEAVQVCAVDGSYDELEKKEVYEIAKEIGVSDADVSKIEAWVEEGISWKKRGEDLLESIASKY